MVYRFRHKHKIRAAAVIAVALIFQYALQEAGAKELPFKVGEKLVFNCKWFLFDAARATSHISEKVNEDGRELLHFSLHTQTTNAIASIWSMDDWFHSFWDPVFPGTRRFKVKIRESSVTKDMEVFFNHEEKSAVVNKNDDPPEHFEIMPGSFDFFTAGHFARTLPLEVRKTYTYPVFEDKKNYDMEVRVIRKKRIPLMGGQIDTILTEVKVKFEGAFQSRGKLHVWYSDDKHKAPVKIKLSSFFGEVIMTVVEYEGVDLKIIKKERK